MFFSVYIPQSGIAKSYCGSLKYSKLKGNILYKFLNIKCSEFYTIIFYGKIYM